LKPCGILVDTNAYFRLAQSIRPLLGESFGKERYCLYVIKELQKEYDKSPRLRNSFPWVNELEYVKNRSHFLPVTRDQKPEISRAFTFILDYVRHVHPGVSRIDVHCLAHAEVLGVPVVTDDAEMREAANAYNIKTYNTLELLKLMLDCGHVNIVQVRGIAGFWNYLKDQPIDFRKDFKRLFGEDAPR
jgi:hypothetical protein